MKKIAQVITITPEGIEIDGKVFPYYLADPRDNPIVVHTDNSSLKRVQITILTDAVVIDPSLFVELPNDKTSIVRT